MNKSLSLQEFIDLDELQERIVELEKAGFDKNESQVHLKLKYMKQCGVNEI